MKSKFETFIRIRLFKIIVGALLVATAILTCIYYKTNDVKAEALLAGMVTGLLVASIQYLLDWNDHQDMENFKKLGVLGMLPHRDDKNYYQQLLNKAKQEIFVLGKTGTRFLDDFAHLTRADSKTLFEALARGVKVRILVVDPQILEAPERQKAEESNIRMAQIAKQHSNFEYRLYNHAQNHSLVKVDDECLFGPIFSHAKSKDSPTVHAVAASTLVKHYLENFDNEWDQAKSPQG